MNAQAVQRDIVSIFVRPSLSLQEEYIALASLCKSTVLYHSAWSVVLAALA
ncbi:MAG: hypothetical protein IMW89_12835 [Ktedonobacteraceae bacterium]|nr:hypothetical protein [Ktedonobacteraceae bacterium]